ncbi:MAG: hypothetical protein IJA35_01760 [Clostridia bacterium]|nr:hypothetical protein [Clostridia bacterium]
MPNIDLNKVIVKTIIKQTINGIYKDPQRTIRRCVEHGCYHAKGRFQSALFNATYNILQNNDSNYYPYIHRIVSDVDPEILNTFAFNVGYNSFTSGAKLIRKYEAEKRFNIPWAISFYIERFSKNIDILLRTIISQGINFGIFTYFVFCSINIVKKLTSVFASYPDCAFVIITEPEFIGDHELTEIRKLKNILLSLNSASPSYFEAAHRAHKQRILYSAHLYYDKSMLSNILFGKLLKTLLPSGCMTLMLIPNSKCSLDTCEAATEYAIKMRENPSHPLLPIELISGIKQIDHIISDDSCALSIDIEGNVFNSSRSLCNINAFSTNLSDILKEACPK